jgi:predicted transport protein
MSLYSISSTLQPIKEAKFNLEKELQTLIEKNLGMLFGLEFIATEFQIENYYIDTLAYDPESNTFVILEYKRDKSFSVVDQGVHYLSLLLSHKADFLLSLQTKRGQLIPLKDIDWSSSRVMFLARSFNQYQIGSTGFRDFPIELWEVTRYENDTLSLELIESPASAEPLTSVVKTAKAKRITQEIVELTTEDVIKTDNEKLKEIFEQVRTQILSLDSRIKENPRRGYLAFRFHGSNFVYASIKKDKLDLAIRIPKFKDPMLPVTMNKQRAWDTTPSWRVMISSEDEVRKLMDLIEQAYRYYDEKY